VGGRVGERARAALGNAPNAHFPNGLEELWQT
jgi:hypothetical protein